MKKIHAMVLLGATALVLAGCGSSNDDTPAAPVATTDIPATATTDSAGLTAFANGQVGASSDTAEPFLVGDAVLPVDDTTETSL